MSNAPGASETSVHSAPIAARRSVRYFRLGTFRRVLSSGFATVASHVFDAGSKMKLGSNSPSAGSKTWGLPISMAFNAASTARIDLDSFAETGRDPPVSVVQSDRYRPAKCLRLTSQAFNADRDA